jgi:hypothetical protein
MSRMDEFDVVIRRKGEKVVAGIPQLRLYSKGETVNEALAALDIRKKAFEESLREAGQLDALELEDLSARPAVSRPAAGDIGRFAVKTTIVVGIIAVTAILSGLLLLFQIERTVDNTLYAAQARFSSVKIGGTRFWSNIEAELDRAADRDRDLPEEKKRKLLSDIHIIVERWRPFVTELASAFSEAPTPNPQGGTQNKP